VREGKLSAWQANTILSLPVERREAMARRAVEEGLSVRALTKLARDGAPKRARKKAAAQRASGDDEAFVEQLRYKFGTHVRVVPHERGGTIELRYSDPPDLIRIVDLLLGETS
jgi:ParB family chromosome partitioning protein